MATGHILGGLLSGIGQGMAAQAQSDAAARREIALENLRSQNKQAEAKTAHGYDMEKIQSQADLNDRNAARNTERTTNSTIVVDDNKAKNQATIENLKTANDSKLKRLDSSLRMNETQAELAQKMVNEATMAGQEVGDTKIGSDGTLYIISKTGKILTQSKPGQFVAPGTKANDDIATVMASRGRGSPQPQSNQQKQTIIRYDAQGNRIQ